MSGTVCQGVVVAGVPVGGLKLDDAERKIAAALKTRQEKPLAVLQSGKARWEVPWDAVNGSPEPASLAKQAYEVGRSGNVLQRIHEQFLLKNDTKFIALGLNADVAKLQAIVDAAAATVDRPPVNATLSETASGIVIKPEQPGIKTGSALTVRKLKQAIEEGRTEAVELVTETVSPLVQAKDLQEINGLIAAFSTMFDSGDEGRSRNIEIAAQAIDGSLIKAGAIFSFNDRVGLRTPEKGYMQAMTLSSEGAVLDWGGGVCQVSTTLYNAALLADFSVVERSAHFQPPAYVPLGQDATVADGQIDLKLKNMRSHPVFIRAIVDAGVLEVRIYGRQDKSAPTVRIESAERTVKVSQTIIKQDSALPLGQEVVESPGSNGFEVTVYRVKNLGMRELSREKISFDEFPGSDRIVRVGTQTISGQLPK